MKISRVVCHFPLFCLDVFTTIMAGTYIKYKKMYVTNQVIYQGEVDLLTSST